jgi:hypothetical protein
MMEEKPPLISAVHDGAALVNHHMLREHSPSEDVLSSSSHSHSSHPSSPISDEYSLFQLLSKKDKGAIFCDCCNFLI